jgi:hypothetical protein
MSKDHVVLLDELSALFEEGETLVEKVDRRPFKRAASIGPGPRHGWPDGPKHQKRDHWKCKCKNYQCRCNGKDGEKKKIKLEPRWKSAYNSEYKAWHRARLHKAAPGHFVGYNKKDKQNKAKRRKKLQKAARKRRIYK